jgi:uncharacterized membrane protein
MARVEQSIEVDVPVRTAYDQWTQFEESPSFMGGVDSVRQLDDTHLHWVVSHDGKQHEFEAEIVEQKPDERIAWRTVDGKSHAGVVMFQPLSEERTQVTVQMDWEPEGMLEELGAKLGSDNRRVSSDLEKFKEMIESRGTETGAWRGEVEHGRVEH